MFRGSNSINMDSKGRIAIPTRYRAEIQDTCERQLIISRALDDNFALINECLWLFPLPEWEALEMKLLKKPKTLKIKRLLIGNAAECEMDGHGRILVPDRLRKIANLEKQLVLLGQLNKFEIWNEQALLKEEENWNDSDSMENIESLNDLTL